MIQEEFTRRHIGPDEVDTGRMLKKIGVNTLDELINKTIPSGIRLTEPLPLPEGISEYENLNTLRRIASRNKIFRTFIGLGYYDTILPAVIQRNILENPSWYTSYTPYQAEMHRG